MQQYQNPNFMYQQPQYNPYMQRMENLQQFQQAIQQPISPTQMPGTSQFTPLGKIVESADIVKVTDIPMDGSTYYFPKADGSEIYAKKFEKDGKTRILTFKPVLESEPNNLSNEEEKLKIGISDEVTEVFIDMLNRIDERISKLESNVTKTTRAKTTTKKEVQNNE